MPKTKSEVIAEAHRRIAVLSVDEDPSSDMVTYAGDEAESLLAELNAAPHVCGFEWTTETVPDAVFRPFAWLLAVDLAEHYLLPPREARHTAMARVYAYAFPDDRPDSRDLDEDGIITDAEAYAGKQAAYY